MSSEGEQGMVQDPVADAIREWAEPDPGLGWVGSTEVAGHAQEIADWLWERGLARQSDT